MAGLNHQNGAEVAPRRINRVPSIRFGVRAPLSRSASVMKKPFVVEVRAWQNSDRCRTSQRPLGGWSSWVCGARNSGAPVVDDAEKGGVGSIPNTQPRLKRGAVSEGMEEPGIERGLSTLADFDSEHGDSRLEMVTCAQKFCNACGRRHRNAPGAHRPWSARRGALRADGHEEGMPCGSTR